MTVSDLMTVSDSTMVSDSIAGFDLIVVGAGTAGLPCAIEAADCGARVLLIDKADDIGGTLHISGGHLSAGGTRRQQERGIDDSAAAHLADVQRISHHSCREDLATVATQRAASTIDWLGEHGFDFADDCPRIVYGHEPYTVPRTYYGTDEARSILAVLRRLIAPHLASGAVELWLESEVKALLTDGGRVVGAAVERVTVERDATVDVRGAAVVLTTGGYGASPTLFREIEGWPLYTCAHQTSTGDGLRLTQPLGGTLTGQGAYMPTFGGLPSPDDPHRVIWKDRPLLVPTEREPWEIYVDRQGRRFMTEDEISMHVREQRLMTLDDLTFFTIFDDRGISESANIVVGWSADDIRQAAGQRPGIFSASTLDELAVAAGIDAAGLRHSVERYNAAVRSGHDEDFGRQVMPAPIEQPPFVAMQNHGITLITFAGLDVDGELRVRRAGGTVIVGLYAAGEILGAAATSGRAFCGGMLLTPALTFGRWLGERLAPSSDVS